MSALVMACAVALVLGGVLNLAFWECVEVIMQQSVLSDQRAEDGCNGFSNSALRLGESRSAFGTSQTVRIIGVDKDSIRKFEPAKDLYAYPFELSVEPNPAWQDLLAQIAEDVYDFPEGTVYTCGRFLVVLVPGRAKMRHWLKCINETVAETNRVYDVMARRQARYHDEDLTALEDDNTVQRLREEADHLIFE